MIAKKNNLTTYIIPAYFQIVTVNHTDYLINSFSANNFLICEFALRILPDITVRRRSMVDEPRFPSLSTRERTVTTELAIIEEGDEQQVSLGTTKQRSPREFSMFERGNKRTKRNKILPINNEDADFNSSTNEVVESATAEIRGRRTSQKSCCCVIQ